MVAGLTTMHAYHNFSRETAVLCRRTLGNETDVSFPGTRYPKDSGSYGATLWISEPNYTSIIVYSIAIPIVSALGIIGNALILAILSKTSLRASTYTYLAVLAGADLVTCGLLLFSGLARGIFWCRFGWLEFDAFVHLPIGSISSNIAVWSAVCVTIDRLAIVCSLSRCKLPKFCAQQVARRLMIFSGFFATVINLPYCFIYTYNERGDLITTEFFHSRWYNLQNWLQFVLFGLIPAIFLLIANAIMCQSVMKNLKQRQLLLRGRNLKEGNNLKDQARLTIMLVGIVFVFLVGEVPTHLASRRSAVSLLYGGDPSRVEENFMQSFRMYATLLNAIASSANFVLYSLLSPHFLSHVKDLLTGKPLAKDNRIIMDGLACARQPTNVAKVLDRKIFLM